MYNPYSLHNKHVLLTGASSGIGRAISIECSKMGAELLLTGRDENRLYETLSKLDNPSAHKMVLADLSDEAAILHVIETVEDPLDGIVLCAGITKPKPFSFITSEDISEVMSVNFNAPVILTKELLRKKKLNKAASVVFISSISGVVISSVGGSLYSASKGAINGIAKALAIELASKKIRVNCVNPGMIDTDIYHDGSITHEQLEEDAKRYPLGRYGEPEEVAHAVIYLLSDASSWVTGSNLLIDGGYTLL